MAADLRIESYLPDLPGPGCCPNKVYALIFNHANLALKKVGTLYGFVTNSGNSNEYKIPLAENSLRTWYYATDILAAELAGLPENLPDEPYWIEYWLQAGSTPNRATDTFQKADRFWWQGGRMVFAPLSSADKALMNYRKAHAAVAYDTTNLLLKFVAWMEKDGQRSVTAQTCEIKWLRRNGTTIAHFTLPASMSQMPGVFQAEQAVTSVDPDEATPVEIKITDFDGTIVTSSCAVTSWD